LFPKNRNDLEDLISTSLINLICFNNELIIGNKESYEAFLMYLLLNGEENIKIKLKNRLIKKKDKIQKDYLNLINNEKIEKINVECDTIYITDFNLYIGCPASIEIASGDEEERLIEVKYPNSILYIKSNLQYYDINLHLIKYCPNINNTLSSKEKREEKKQYEDYQYFYEIFSLEKISRAKIILFAKSPGIYKILFDNKYSWFTSKAVEYTCVILKELNGLNMSPCTSNDEIKMDIVNNEKDEKKEENNNNENNENEGDNIDDKKVEKIDVKLSDNENSNDNEDLNKADEDLK
jgi:hypothetical protein